MPSIEKTGNASDSLVVGQSPPRIDNSTGILPAQTSSTDTIQPHLETPVLQHESSNCFMRCCIAIKTFFSCICTWICSLFASKEKTPNREVSQKEKKPHEENNKINNPNQASIAQLPVEQMKVENSSSKSTESLAEKQQEVQKTPLIEAHQDNEDPAFAITEDVKLAITLFKMDLIELEFDVQECYNKLESEILKSEEVAYCCLASLTQLKIETISILELVGKLKQRPISKEQLQIASEQMSAKIKEIFNALKQPFSTHRANQIRDSVEKFCAGKFLNLPDPSTSLFGFKAGIALKLFDLINSVRKNIGLDPLSTPPEHISETKIDNLKIGKCYISLEILKQDIPKRYKNRIETRDDALRYLLDIQKLTTLLDAFQTATNSEEAPCKKLPQLRTLHQQIRDHLEKPLPTIGEAEHDQARAMINILTIIPIQWTILWSEYLAANPTAPRWSLDKLVNDIRTESGLEPIT